MNGNIDNGNGRCHKNRLVTDDVNVHGLLFWKVPEQKCIDLVDRVVFLGDYLDPYGDEGVIMMQGRVLDFGARVIYKRRK